MIIIFGGMALIVIIIEVTVLRIIIFVLMIIIFIHMVFMIIIFGVILVYTNLRKRNNKTDCLDFFLYP
ncbi:hypothetical protein GLOIN_2v1512410 [Rhizophagus irregularis DAOM 181602=DAOM 197198]|uniref:Uncharacterized protein n=1 Tax=Rhizophagus irregularis (strain DAOM 181602 / DAOM 197198 / MUCL 43194) TaxID=747089 RepID=A0A2P4QSW6_RHIID|nr:hypothetical protein GLOIN_2v1512410 [Rhizophagus irregularis DAOM 181602=DAOM 197198]POG80747.1 hypothetical protein GLOIN_2v1512410 [Rhizophagus irregularis DAOM 181602=DAOM 197198]|eukprot:XP_025187613.1 hypothetical protein GLOIN_2v1512410 [Rhizophagus irregularis DAOM 181602=DAOM 197198]